MPPANPAAVCQEAGYAANRAELDLPNRFADPSVKKNVELDLALLLDTYDQRC